MLALIASSSFMVFSGVMKLVKPAQVVEGFTHLGWDEKLALPLGIVEITCALIYALPRTAILGAILLTGHLGGSAIATHVRIGEPFYAQSLFGVLVWLGIYLQCGRLRAILPVRTCAAARKGRERGVRLALWKTSRTTPLHNEGPFGERAQRSLEAPHPIANCIRCQILRNVHYYYEDDVRTTRDRSRPGG